MSKVTIDGVEYQPVTQAIAERDAARRERDEAKGDYRDIEADLHEVQKELDEAHLTIKSLREIEDLKEKNKELERQLIQANQDRDAACISRQKAEAELAKATLNDPNLKPPQ